MLNPVLAFALTALIIEITPGPNMTYLAALSLSNGMRSLKNTSCSPMTPRPTGRQRMLEARADAIG